MKNTITRNTALKTIGSLILLVLLNLPFKLFSQVQNIPPELYTVGTLKNPLPILENDPTKLWSFLNETDFDLSMSMYFKLQFIEVPKVYNNINLPGTSEPTNPSLQIIPSSSFYNYFGLTSNSYNMTNLVFDIVINGFRTTVDPYNIVTIPNTPCGCLLWIPDMVHKTFTIKRC